MQTPIAPVKLSLFAALALVLSACGGQGNPFAPGADPSSSSELDLALGAEYGALTDGDEEPDFADEEIATEDDLNDDGTDVEDDAAEDEVASIEEEYPALPVRRVPMLLLWGKLVGEPPAADAAPLDWSGTLTIENGGLLVRRTVAFDENDAIVRPRPDIHTVEVVSFTKPHVDGLVVEVLLHPALGSSLETLPVLHIDSASYQGSLTLRPGMDRRNLELIDEAGNGVAYMLLPRREGRPGCRQGFIAGRWSAAETTDDGRTVGRLKGKVLDETGHVVGKLRGVWGEREASGNEVFFAKIIDNEGRFRAVIAGRYEGGHFQGRVLGKDHVRIGLVGGVYRASPVGDGGGFRGRIGELCGDAPGEGTAEIDDEDSAGVAEANAADGAL